MNSEVDLRAVEAFVEVVRRNSFTKAAHHLLLTQPTVSARIASLERALGTRLLDRDRSGAELTPAGHVFLPHARTLLRTRETATHAVRQFVEDAPLQLSIGASSAPGTYLLPRYLTRVREKFPRLRVLLRVTDSDSTLSALRAKEVELGLVGRRVRDRDLRSTDAGSDEVVLVAAPDLLPGAPSQGSRKRATRRRVSLSHADLLELPLALREEGSATRSVALEALSRMGITTGSLRVVVELGTSEAALEAALSGLGAAFVTSLALRDHVTSGRLVRVDIEGLDIVRPLLLVRRRGGDLSAPARELLNAITSGG